MAKKDSTPPADESQSTAQDQAPAADDKPTDAADAAAATDAVDAPDAPDAADAVDAPDSADADDPKTSTPAKAPKKTSKPRRKPKVAAKAEAAPPAKDKADKPAVAPGPSGAPPDGHWWWGTGRRKRAVARVRIRPGDGKFVINKRPYETYFTEERDRNDLMNVLNKTNTAGSLDIHVNLHGGGYMGQAGAIVLGLARALRKYDESLEPILRSNGLLSRDPRKVERKKYGQPGARKRFQFSKR